jgi:hypothetical protein
MRVKGFQRVAGLLLGLTFVLGACSHNAPSTETAAASDPGINVPPTDHKHEILGAMHAYLNDPTGIRDAEIAQPAVKTVGNFQRYVVCLRFNGKKRGNEYAGVKEIAAVFMVGRFDRFIDKAQEQCAGATYAPFPELQKLSR